MKYSSFITHAAAALIITGLCLLIYAAVQQGYRSTANYPQLQLARDIAYRLEARQPIDKLLPCDSIDLERSLGLFVTLYNSNGEPIQTTGTLNGKMPKPPMGTLEFARSSKENVVTWQPQEGVRQAVVVESVNNSPAAFVMAGRSLQEVERNESNLVQMVFIAWICCLAVVVAHWVVQAITAKKG